ncbi:hypothetical protein [Sphingomonas aerophila]|uniref:Uncharacterized protein n=1 Tax=Sphingomonas aerophila TaxID=1344948 RepID=A0A7W9BGH2_9SPHN|nr:hypothetical protein [Sphingomonas aerophila]
MELKRAGSQPSQPGPATYFTKTVRIDPLNAASTGPALVRSGHLRARRAVALAHAPARPDADRHRRLWLDPVRG